MRAGTGPGGAHEAVDPLAGVGTMVRERRRALDQLEAASHELSRVYAAGLMRTDKPSMPSPLLTRWLRTDRGSVAVTGVIPR